MRALALGATSLALQHLLERPDTPGVEGRSGICLQEGNRLFVRPRRAIDAGRDERVIDVANAQDPGVEGDRIGVEPTRVAVAVESLVVVVDEPANRRREAADLVEELGAPLAVSPDQRVLLVVQRARLLEDGVRNRQLPDVVDERPDRKRAQPPRREAQRLADLNRRAWRRGGCAAPCTRPSRPGGG